jgi:hypothetical protein
MHDVWAFGGRRALKMPPPRLKAGEILGIILTCAHRSCRRRAWLDPASVTGRTVPDLQAKAKCSACGHRGAGVEIVWPELTVGARSAAKEAERAARLKQWVTDHPRG